MCEPSAQQSGPTYERGLGTLTKRLILFGFSTRVAHTHSLASLSAVLSLRFLTSTPIGQTTIDFIMPQFLLLLLPFQSSVSLWIPLNIPFPDALEGHLKDVRGQNKPICSVYSVQPEVTSILNCLHLIFTRDGELIA